MLFYARVDNLISQCFLVVYYQKVFLCGFLFKFYRMVAFLASVRWKEAMARRPRFSFPLHSLLEAVI